jgi:hypothetical protein
MSKYTYCLMLVVILLAAGCGSENNGSDPTHVPTLDPNLPTSTPGPTATALPPTWTPPPTVTKPGARPTLEITRDRPTATMVILPSYTPSTEPPTPTPPGPTLTITVESLNQAIYTKLSSGSGNLFEVPPTVLLQDGILLISFNLLNSPGDISSAIPIRIEAGAYVVDGRINIVKNRSYRTDTSAAAENEVVDNVVMTVEDELSALVEQAFRASQPGKEQFFVSDLVVTDTGITIQTVSM